MLREKRVAEEEFVSIHQNDIGLSAKRGGTCIPGVLCVIGLILAIALLTPALFNTASNESLTTGLPLMLV